MTSTVPSFAFYPARDSTFLDPIVILKPSWTRDNGPFVSSDETSVMAVMAVMPLPDGPVGRFTRRREPCFHRHFPEEWI
jgi:hypothetical protein